MRIFISLIQCTRAYIAASRRSDRCLTARMQSARRASEIHQERTGRALRVTEAIVVAEEMYEEITDVSSDRHLWRVDWNTRSEDLGRRLLAHLASQRSARYALDQTVPGSWKEQRLESDSAALVNHDSLQAPSFPQHMLDMAPRNSPRHTPYPVGSWDPQPRHHVYQALMTPLFDEYTLDQQCMGPPQSPWSDVSRRMSLPTTPAPQTYHSPTWTSTSPSNCSPSPIQRADSVADQPDVHQSMQQQPIAHQQHYSRLATGNLTDTLLPALPIGTTQLLASSARHKPDNQSRSVSTTTTATSPKHDFSDRRYSYNPNIKPNTAPMQQPPSLSHTPQMSWHALQTPSPLHLDGSPDDLRPYDVATAGFC